MGILYIVSTPIGNLDDITLRAIKTLFTVDYIACEDTRRTGQMLKIYESGIKNQELRIIGMDKMKIPRLISYYDEIESLRSLEIIDLLLKDNNVALVSDSGTPLLADPGFKLINECIKRNIKVTSIPGPTALISGLVVSGLPSNQFTFLGFAPNKESAQKKLFQEMLSCSRTSKQKKATYILYCAPHKLVKILHTLKDVFGDIEVVIARELTKKYENVFKDKISLLLEYTKSLKGEMVILFSLS